MPNFEDTEIAFANTSNAKLRKSYYIFQFFQFNTLVDWGGRLAQWGLKWHLPVGLFAKPTIFGQFVGGVTLKETEKTVNRLAKSGVKGILDYAIEGKTTERAFDDTLKHKLEMLEYVQHNDNVKLISVKVTGLGKFSLLERVHRGDERALGEAAAEVDAVEHLVRLLADDLHQVDLAAGGPATVGVVHRQHPQRRPQALAPGHLGAELETTVPLVEQRLLASSSCIYHIAQHNTKCQHGGIKEGRKCVAAFLFTISECCIWIVVVLCILLHCTL